MAMELTNIGIIMAIIPENVFVGSFELCRTIEILNPQIQILKCFQEKMLRNDLGITE